MIKKVIIRGYRIFRELVVMPDPSMSIIVGDNETGKSTLLEAIALALTAHIDGRWAGEELNPYWFNNDLVRTFFDNVKAQTPAAPPEIEVELYFDSTAPEIQRMRGMHNSCREDSPGVALRVALNPDYAAEFCDYMQSSDRPDILPTEYFAVSWRDFNDTPMERQPKGLGVSFIDSRTIRSKVGVDHHTRQILSSFLDPKTRAEISVVHRKSRHDMTTGALAELNAKIAAEDWGLHDKQVGLTMDQSARASWETGVVPQVGEVPFAMAGQGQQAAIKVALALHRTAVSTRFVLIEEPETHLAYSSLHRLVDRIQQLAGTQQQLFLTTHSSFVLNRLGLDRLLLLRGNRICRITDLSGETVSYFKHLSGYDTLRLVLADRLVLVEGASDEMVFKRGYKDTYGQYPEARGVDVLSMNGLSYKRALELCAQLKRDVVVIRDNDGTPADEHRLAVATYLSDERQLIAGDPVDGSTLEPQLIMANGEEHLRTVLGLSEKDRLETWMPNHKTEAALRILTTPETITMPTYLTEAIALLP